MIKCKANNESVTLVFILKREAPKRKLVKIDRELITKEVFD